MNTKRFISFIVTGEPDYTIHCDQVASVLRTASTTTTINYTDGKTATLTHAADTAAASVAAFINEQVIDLYRVGSDPQILNRVTLPQQVSGVAIA